MTIPIDDLPIPEETRVLVKRGFRIIPLRNREKIQILKRWKNFATTDPDQIAAWAHEFPDCNWGIPTGKESGFFVVDVDGEDGTRTTEEWSRQHGESWKQTLGVQAAHGPHLYYLCERQTISNSVKQIAPGIDIRGEGGQVVAPGSIHPTGHVYRLTNDLPIASPPEWLLAMVTNKRPSCRKKGENGSAIVIQTVAEGGRNSYLASQAGSMRRKSFSPSAIEAALLQENADRCNPPLPEDEVVSVAKSVCRYEPDHTPPSTQIGLKDLFIKEFGDDFRIVEGYEWRVWEPIERGGRWKVDATREVEDCIQRFLVTQASFEPKLRAGFENASMVRNLLHLLRADQRIALTRDRFDVNPMVLNTPSGLVDFELRRIRPVQREDLCSKITAVGPKKMPTPRWTSYLNLFHPDTEIQRFLKRVSGYWLTGDMREQVLLFGYGPAKNGKSTFAKTISHVMGDYATTPSMDAFISDDHHSRHPTDLAALVGARLAIAVETQEGRWWDEVKLKQCTGGDRIAARFMREDFFTFYPQFKLFFLGNHRPRIRNVDDAMRRRFLVVPFEVTLSEEQRIRGFEEKLKLEGPGILRWMIEGTLAWLHGEYEECSESTGGKLRQIRPPGLLPPPSIIDASREYMEAEDAPGQWLEERTERSPNQWTRFSALYADYKQWAHENGVAEWSGKRFSTWLSEQRGFRSEKQGGGARGFRGITLRDAPM